MPAIPSLVSAVVIRQQFLRAVEWKTAQTAHWDPISTCLAQAGRMLTASCDQTASASFPTQENGSSLTQGTQDTSVSVIKRLKQEPAKSI